MGDLKTEIFRKNRTIESYQFETWGFAEYHYVLLVNGNSVIVGSSVSAWSCDAKFDYYTFTGRKCKFIPSAQTV